MAAGAMVSAKWLLPGAGRPGDDQVLRPAGPLQGGQGVLGGGVASGDLVREQHAQDLGGLLSRRPCQRNRCGPPVHPGAPFCGVPVIVTIASMLSTRARPDGSTMR
ncbi:MAG TPA: hypothetical protein VFQ68_30550 [Streptosporangiaceae bacterium]|nr:hypothetical protein [Streptosporangiaceae bacterium]